MRATLRDASATIDDIGHIQAHGLGSRTSDIAEAQAIRAIFGTKTDKLPVCAAKSYFGNLGAGSGAVELCAGVLALKNRRLFRTLNYDTPDPECPVAVATQDGMDPGSSFLNLSVTVQGQASCVMVRALN